MAITTPTDMELRNFISFFKTYKNDPEFPSQVEAEKEGLHKDMYHDVQSIVTLISSTLHELYTVLRLLGCHDKADIIQDIASGTQLIIHNPVDEVHKCVITLESQSPILPYSYASRKDNLLKTVYVSLIASEFLNTVIRFRSFDRRVQYEEENESVEYLIQDFRFSLHTIQTAITMGSTVTTTYYKV